MIKEITPFNVTLAMDHARDGARLINDAYRMDDDIVDDADFARKYNEAINTRNSTMYGLVIANIVDQVLKEYGEAFDIDYDLTNMSNLMMEVPRGMPPSSIPSGSTDYATINNNSTIQNVNSELEKSLYLHKLTHILGITQISYTIVVQWAK